jgi:hypothetical protein
LKTYVLQFSYGSDEEAVKLIEADVPTKRKKDKSQWNEVDMGSILSFELFLLFAKLNLES